MTYIDTNVLIDLLDEDAARYAGCLEKLEEAQAQGKVFISDIVYSEASIGMPTKDALDEAVTVLRLSRTPFSDEALFRAGRAFKQYKDANSGPKNNVLPDFLIGAQADVDGVPLITSDAKRMMSYFPSLVVVQP